MTNTSIQGLIIDMDGVLWKENDPLIDIGTTFENIRKSGRKFVLATNNSSRTPQQYLEKIVSLGGSVNLEHIITSSIAASFVLKQKFPLGGPVYLIGEDGLFQAMEEQGFYYAEDSVIAVIAGLDRQFNYQKMSIANHLIRKGAPFYGTNPDLTYPSPTGSVPGAGSIIAAIEAASGSKPIFCGKPEPVLYEMALSKMGILAANGLMIGDRLDTDILGGQRMGCRTAIVLSGISTLSEIEKWSPKPDIIESNLEKIVYDLE